MATKLENLVDKPLLVAYHDQLMTDVVGAFEDEVRGLVDTPHQRYVTVEATSQTSAATDVLPASGQSADTIYRVSNWDGSTNSYDITVYSEYAWDDVSNPNKYIFLCVKPLVGEVFDITVYNNNTKYANLAAALGTNGANVPASVRKGGMSIKYVNSSDNKYVQYRYMGTSITNGDFANVANWQNGEPKIIDSDEYVKIELDKENKILSCTKTDGTKYVYLITDFINGLKSKGKDVITTDDFTQEIRDKISLLPNEIEAQFVKVLLDNKNKLIESIDKNGNKTVYGDVSIEGHLYNEELNAELNRNPFPSYKLHNFHNPIFCGDSVTAGYWVEGTEEHRETSTGADVNNRYPTIFGQFYPHMNITVEARGGITATQWLADFFPTINFSEYDMVVIELGYNGLLVYNDIDVEGTNTNSYKKIVQGVRTQNQTAEIILVISSHSAFVIGWKSILDKFAEDYRCKVIDLTSKKYLNLDDAKYHGWSSETFDWAHFTRKGYRAKAYVVAREIADVLTDDTYYN